MPKIECLLLMKHLEFLTAAKGMNIADDSNDSSGENDIVLTITKNISTICCLCIDGLGEKKNFLVAEVEHLTH